MSQVRILTKKNIFIRPDRFNFFECAMEHIVIIIYINVSKVLRIYYTYLYKYEQ